MSSFLYITDCIKLAGVVLFYSATCFYSGRWLFLTNYNACTLYRTGNTLEEIYLAWILWLLIIAVAFFQYIGYSLIFIDFSKGYYLTCAFNPRDCEFHLSD